MGENFGSKQGENKYIPKFQRGSNFDSKGGEKEEEVANMGKTKGMIDLGGGQVNIG